ncbi:MAG: zf-HC2 domain-containing protein [Elusimicrobia bacterium]|nr:zf-HC2 domain-containing protein [Elusimicrobiota bacterium]
MKSHVVELLSAFLDGELSPEQSRSVEAHLSGCSDCRSRLEDLRSLSKMLSSLPKRELPAGFLQRLRARQARDAVEGRRLPFFAWTMPVRAAAMALSALVVMFVAYEGLRERGSAALPASQEAADSFLDKGGAVKPEAKGAAAPVAMRAAARQGKVPLGPKAAAFRQKTRALSHLASGAATGAPSGAAASLLGAQAEAPTVAPSAAPTPPAPPALAGGAPLGESAQAGPRYTNEELQAMLEAEKKRMGIERIVPPRQKPFPSDEEWIGAPHPDRQDISPKMAAAHIEGDTPAIITPTSLQTAAAPAGISLGPPGTRGEGRTFAPARQRPSRWQPGRSDSALDRAADASAAPKDVRAFGKTEVLAARSKEELDLVWTRHNILLPKPTVDFSRQMVVLVPPSEEDNSACDILSTEETASALLVRCRKRESSYGERSLSVSFRVVPIKDLPLRLETVK